MNRSEGKRILLLDDEVLLTRMCRQFLSDGDYAVFEAHDLKGARELLRTEAIHLVLCDLTLGDGESGLDLLHELLPQAPDVAVCMMTASQDLQLAVDCLRDGAFDFLTKPFRREDLRKAVERALGRRAKMIDEREEAQAMIRALARFPEDNPNPVFRVDPEGKVLYSNEAGRNLLSRWGAWVGERLREELVALIRVPGPASEVEVVGGERIFSFTATGIAGGEESYLYGHDVTEWKKAERELVRLKNEATELSLRDQLTGMANRSRLESRFVELTRTASDRAERFAFILLDLDNFKEINDLYGHETGDRVLVQLGHRLRQALGPEDVLCRWGGDEMVILKTAVTGASELDHFCRQLLALARDPLPSADYAFPITLSIGYTVYPDDGDTLDLLTQRADQALYRAKEMGKDTWQGYRRLEYQAVFRRNPELLVRFSRAVMQGKIDVHYQPILDVRSGRVVAAEALARWSDPELGSISPGHFIPEAEERGIIGKLGEDVLGQALDALVHWRRAGAELTLSVNLSRRQLLNRDFLDGLNREMGSRGLPAASLTLEITERHSFFDTSIGRERLGELIAAGYGVSLDDFGTGYSSLSEIASMPFTELKIAMGLTRQVIEEKGRKIVQAICLMGNGLDLTLVAEGVETEVEVNRLREMGVSRLQGFYYARPMPGDEIPGFVHGKAVGA